MPLTHASSLAASTSAASRSSGENVQLSVGSYSTWESMLSGNAIKGEGNNGSGDRFKYTLLRK